MRNFRAATLLTLIIFLAFGFQVIGVFSEPVSRGYLPIAKRDNYNYGVLGWCPSSQDDGLCSDYGVGYELQSDSKWSSSQQRTLSQIMIVHIIAAGMLAIALFLVISVHTRNQALWVVTLFWLVLCFCATTLSFVVEIVLFGGSLYFPGYFALAAAILSLLGVIGMALMLRQLRRTGHERTNSLQDNSFSSSVEAGVFENNGGGYFRGNHDDEKLLKPKVKVSQAELPPLPAPKVKGPQLKTTSVYHGYQKVPENNAGLVKPNQLTPKTLPLSTSTGSIGAISKPITNLTTGTIVGEQPQQQKSTEYLRKPPQLRQNANLQRNQSDAASIASTEINTRVPAGSYVHTLPAVREPDAVKKVPNYSRMSANLSAVSPNAVKNSPMLQRYVEDEANNPLPQSQDMPQQLVSAPPPVVNMVPVDQSEVASSHYSTNTISTPALLGTGPNGERIPTPNDSTPTIATTSTGYNAYDYTYYQQQQQQLMQQQIMQRQQQYQQYQQYNQQYQQPQYQQQQYNQYNQYNPQYQSSPVRPPPNVKAPMRSELALNSNPDFALTRRPRKR